MPLRTAPAAIRPLTSGGLILLATLFTALVIGACAHKPGGSGESRDTFTYISTPHLPQTVSLIDTTRGQTLWTCEIPVGQQLVVRFVNEGTDAVARGTDVMRWSLMPIKSGRNTLDNEMVVPPATARRIDGIVRSTPEPYTTALAPMMNNSTSPGAYTTSADADAKAKAANPKPVETPAAAPVPAPAPTSEPQPAPAPAAAPEPQPEPAAPPAGDPPVDLPE